ncbi:hypothetical protein PR003_g15086 [Phytophthora rubi]|uniref:Uncharacterized protein n=1 Tax=Phytophthora rubi TaxID=129364 RepID=A0A6A4FA55_9STRA|nr:hypothetical protein PR003_g15086 [Phytophthora rubi]
MREGRSIRPARPWFSKKATRLRTLTSCTRRTTSSFRFSLGAEADLTPGDQFSAPLPSQPRQAPGALRVEDVQAAASQGPGPVTMGPSTGQPMADLSGEALMRALLLEQRATNTALQSQLSVLSASVESIQPRLATPSAGSVAPPGPARLAWPQGPAPGADIPVSLSRPSGFERSRSPPISAQVHHDADARHPNAPRARSRALSSLRSDSPTYQRLVTRVMNDAVVASVFSTASSGLPGR